MRGVLLLTYQHLLVLADANALALHHLDILQSTQDLMLDLENDLGAELGALLDHEGFLLELLQGIGTRQVHHDIWTARRLDCQ